ncbi:hypothetical protein L226DRAFT_574983 [Lentinus tigrinus ALCF2SS1-7]|uniref:uncharacterized protein n=1 Tax=Lentinus tigrinus ALCF2SS1-7 TaxID=1328758 RepID=UPI00116630C2|nr:hypothetical protein L226DRAFT_574983 [Lentinus tigrinus ALCF2SS1-7]
MARSEVHTTKDKVLWYRYVYRPPVTWDYHSRRPKVLHRLPEKFVLPHSPQPSAEVVLYDCNLEHARLPVGVCELDPQCFAWLPQNRSNLHHFVCLPYPYTPDQLERPLRSMTHLGHFARTGQRRLTVHRLSWKSQQETRLSRVPENSLMRRARVVWAFRLRQKELNGLSQIVHDA